MQWLALILPMLCWTSTLWGSFLKEPRPDIQFEKTFKVFASQLAKKNRMQLLNTGIGKIVDSPKTRWDMSLTSHQQWTIEQARPVVVEMIHDFWQKVSQDPIFAKYLEYTASHYKKDSFDARIIPETMGMRIAFWDQNIDRPPAPYLSQIKVVDGLIHYYVADPKDQSLKEPPFTETFAEAFEIIKKSETYQ